MIYLYSYNVFHNVRNIVCNVFRNEIPLFNMVFCNLFLKASLNRQFSSFIFGVKASCKVTACLN